MKSITAVGFDMDYTLAQYKPESFEALAYRLTVDKLVSVFGYPALIKEFEFDWRYMVRAAHCSFSFFWTFFFSGRKRKNCRERERER